MSKVQNTSGRFVWHELVTPDPKAALGFYGELFGWTSTEMDMGPGGKYTIFKSGETQVGGATPPPKGTPVPPSWLLYCSVLDVDAAASKAKALGGKIMAPPTDIPTIGRFSVIVDPQGAALAAFKQVEEQPEAEGAPAVGTFCWNELLTSAPEAAVKFYTDIYGWKSVDRDMGPMGTYHRLMRGEKMAGGIFKSPMPNAPPAWLAYVAVNDVDAKAKQAEKLKGKIIAPPNEIPGIGRFAVIADAQGAVSALFKADPSYQGA